jgi:DNA-binding response OmpR family regulator
MGKAFPRIVPRAGGGSGLSNVLLLTGGHETPAEILPSLTLLPHAVRVAPAVAASLGVSPVPDAVLVDARRDLVQAKRLLQALRTADRGAVVLVIVTEGGWAALAPDWGADDIVLHTAGPGEVEARLRLAVGRAAGASLEQGGEIRSGELVINETTYSARMNGRSLDLTFKEFELLKFLTQQPGRVFTRAQLLQEVWGYDYFGGTRTVDVHVRRLRAKLGAENESLIGTVRNVGYRFVPAKGGHGRPADGDLGGPAEPAADEGEPQSQDVEPAAAEPAADARMAGGTPAASYASRGPQGGRADATTRRRAGSAHADR